jgi:hypothetical protein
LGIHTEKFKNNIKILYLKYCNNNEKGRKIVEMNFVKCLLKLVMGKGGSLYSLFSYMFEIFHNETSFSIMKDWYKASFSSDPACCLEK